MRFLAGGIIVIGCLVSGPAWATTRPYHPDLVPRPPDAFVLDQAGLIQPDMQADMEQFLGALLRDLDIEFAVAPITGLHGWALNQFATVAFEQWEVGRKTRANRGMLLVIATAERRVRFEVSYDLEAIAPDAFISYVEHQQMAPYFASGHIAEGIAATIELIVKRCYDGVLGKVYDPAAMGPADIGGYHTGGAGAQASVTFGGAAAPAPAGDDVRSAFGPQPTPEAAWKAFLEVNQRRINDPDLGLYDEATKALLRQRINTDAGQHHVVQLYAGQPYEIRQQGDRAAVLFLNDPNHLLAPWFFHRTAEGWQFDGGSLPDLIMYNHLNQWHFRRRDHPYTFAFTDYVFDQHGFAFYRPARAKDPN